MIYDEARVRMADFLEKNAAGYSTSPRNGYDDMDGALPRSVGAEWTKVFIALSFWDGWIDASNHEWRYYDPIGQNDWPELAREIAGDLRCDREITNPEVLKRFGPRTRVPLVNRIKALFSGGA